MNKPVDIGSKDLAAEIVQIEHAARRKGESQVVVQSADSTLAQMGYYPEKSAWVKDLSADTQLLTFEPENWQADIQATLVFLLRDEEVLLIRKLTGHGKGKINGPGGKLEPGETPVDCARREMVEEVGLLPCGLRQVASLRFIDAVKADWLGHIFIASSASGTLKETREAQPFWCPLNAIPFDEMWRDDRLWLPEVLAHKMVSGTFWFLNDALCAHRFVSRGASSATGKIDHHEDQYFDNQRS